MGSSLYTWQSLLAAKSVLQRGLRWRVGNGQSVCMWNDKWLPKPTTFHVISPVNLLHFNAKVCELIDNDLHWLSSTLLDVVFLPEEAKIIKRVPLPRINVEGKLIRNGFTVL